MTKPTQIPTQKWTTFTCVGKETTFVTNLFKKTNIKIAFRTNNTIQKLLMRKQQTTDIHSHSRVYRLTCTDYGKAYVGQTGGVLTHGSENTKTLSEQQATPPTLPNT
jgi:NCAIR mutase (PurE)-related protein